MFCLCRIARSTCIVTVDNLYLRPINYNRLPYANQSSCEITGTRSSKLYSIPICTGTVD